MLANELRTNMFNTGQANSAAASNAGNDRANAIYNSRGQYAADAGNRDFDWGTMQAGLGGLQGIQNADIGQAQAERDRMLQSYSLTIRSTESSRCTTISIRYTAWMGW